MAITINGSGTITGISAGGLPDGSVTAADLASGAITSGALPSGSVLQVVQSDYSTQVNNGGTSYIDTGLSGTITPSSTSSKILVLINQYYTFRTTTTSSRAAYWRLVGQSVLEEQIYTKYNYNNANDDNEAKIAAFNYLDSPSTTSAVTYKTQFRLNGSAADLYCQQSSTTSFMTLLEIAG